MALRPAVAAVAALLIAVQVVRNAAVHALAEMRPADAASAWSGHPESEIGVAMTDIAQAGQASVTVFSPTPGGGTSTAAILQIANFIPGDLNGDGKIDASDLVLLANALAGNVTLTNQGAADVFQDGIINAADLVTLANFLAGNISTLPVKPN